MRRPLYLLLCATFLVMTAAPLLYAQDDGEGAPVKVPCDISKGDVHFECIPQYLAQAVVFFFSFTGAISLVMIIWGGYEITIGSVVPGMNERGKNRITFAIIGLIVSILAFGIINLVLDTTAR